MASVLAILQRRLTRAIEVELPARKILRVSIFEVSELWTSNLKDTTQFEAKRTEGRDLTCEVDE